MLTIDIISEIALYTNFNTTINILNVLPQLNTIYLWKKKCYNKPYFDFWTGPENFLLDNIFCLNISFKVHFNIDPFLYEYTPMLKRVLTSINSNGDGYLNQKIIKVKDIKQYILLYHNFEDILYINSYHCENEALDKIDNICKLDGNIMIIINLKYMTPSFIHYNNKKYNHHYNSHITLYDCDKGNKRKMF
jgi:hypothetical protein